MLFPASLIGHYRVGLLRCIGIYIHTSRKREIRQPNGPHWLGTFDPTIWREMVPWKCCQTSLTNLGVSVAERARYNSLLVDKQIGCPWKSSVVLFTAHLEITFLSEKLYMHKRVATFSDGANIAWTCNFFIFAILNLCTGVRAEPLPNLFCRA